MNERDTICAISTPSGIGGIGIVRISGERAHEIVRGIFSPKRQELTEFLSHKMYLGYIKDPKSGEIVDEVLTVFMQAPNTYTKEDMAEIHAHGGYVVQKRILDLLLYRGARLAEPGEFTKRAFLNGRIDLAQAESVLDIIRSETDEELKCALSYLRGKISERVNHIKEQIRDALVFLEAAIDFSDEDITFDEKTVPEIVKKALSEIEELIESFYEGRAIKEGLELLIVGKPNVGKSSLLNVLLKKERAIVTSIPGTTRDLIEDTLYIKGIKAKLVDSCGIRDPKDPVEEEGVKRVKEKLERVDLVLFILDGSRFYSEEDEEIFHLLNGKRFLAIINKIDLPQALERRILEERGIKWMEISALKEIGIKELKDGIYEALMARNVGREGMLITNIRHKEALVKAKGSLKKAMRGIDGGLSPEFIAFDLYEALYHLSELTGETAKEDVINEIFERFCIGK